jgi:ATP-dependent RNA helicase DeaD
VFKTTHHLKHLKKIMITTTKFSDLFLNEEIQKAITEMGFETPTPIQEQSIPVMLAGHDMIGQAQTGTGKTAAFGLPILEKINPRERKVQALILCPTRELCVQIAEEMEKMAAYMPGVKILSIYGGDSYTRQIRGLKDGVQIVAGTPGRIMDHLRRGTLDISNLKIAVMDEADEMLNMGFREDMETILQDTPANKQTVMFSATMSKPIQEISQRFLKKPQIIKMGEKTVTASTIDQIYFETRGVKKSELISNLIQLHELKLSLVFCNTKARTDMVTEELRKSGLKAEALHGDLSQNMRNMVLGKFKSAEINVLVATDVAARGLDVNNVDAVFNFDLPHDNEYYVHRIGRTGRAGKAGKAFSFAESRNDDRKIFDLEKFIKMRIRKSHLPTKREILEASLGRFENQLMSIASDNDLKDYENLLHELYQKGFDAHLLAACLLKKNLDENGISLKITEPERVKHESKEKPAPATRKSPVPDSNSQKVRMHLGLGKKDRIKPGDIVGAITGECKIPGTEIGVIDMFDHFSYFEITESHVRKVLKNMKHNTIKGKKVMISIARN